MLTRTHNFGHEGTTIEFKTSIVISAGDHDKDQLFVVFSTACAMMNTKGGIIYIGVRDNGEIALGPHYGIRGDKEKLHIKTNDAFARWINQKIATYFFDEKYVRGKMQAEEYSDDVICIEVKKADKVVYIHERSSTDRLAYRREGATTRIMNKGMIAQREHDLSKEKAEQSAACKQEQSRLRILDAIERKRKIILFGYCSSNSDSKEDRIVEPIKFICNGRSLWAYEEAKEKSGPCRQFKLCRIENVKVLDENWTHEASHKEVYLDAFEWSRTTPPTIHISILLGPAAKNRLIENAPEAKKYLLPLDKDQWSLDTDVHSLNPVKSFCRDFVSSVTVFAPDALKRDLGDNTMPTVDIEEEDKAQSPQTEIVSPSPIMDNHNQAVTNNDENKEPHIYGVKGLIITVKSVIDEYLQAWRRQRREISPCAT